MRNAPNNFVFLCGAHFDQIMRLDQSAIMGVSNPAKIENIPGGAALNSASTAAALGLKVTLLSPIGDDINGRQLVEVCKERRIKPALVTTDNLPTGIYSAIFNPDGDIVIGASDLSIYNVINSDWLHTYLPQYTDQNCGLLVNANLEGTLLKEASANGNFLAAATISPAKAKRLARILDRLDCLFTNLGEARVLADQPDMNATDLAGWMIEQNVSSGTISQGGNDLVYWCEGKIDQITPGSVTNLVDVNGAGDALAGAVLAALAKGKTFPDAVNFASRVAAFSLTHDGPYSPKLTSEGPRIT